MCFVSMVMDSYKPQFPEWKWTQEIVPNPAIPSETKITLSTLGKEDLAKLEKLIAEFKEAVAIANRLDVLTKKPDCVDPEKEKLVARVAELEAQLAAIRAAIGTDSPPQDTKKED